MKSKYINIDKMIGRELAHNKCWRNTYLIKANKKSSPSSSKFPLLEARVQACYPGSTIQTELHKCWIWNWVWGNWSCDKCGDSIPDSLEAAMPVSLALSFDPPRCWMMVLSVLLLEQPWWYVGYCFWMHSSNWISGPFGDSVSYPVCGDSVACN